MPRLPRGLTQTPKGWRITLGPAGAKLRKRYPPSKTQAEMETELERLRQGAQAGRGAPLAGSLKADIARYLLAYFQGRSGYAERKRHLELWQTALGEDTWRRQITREDISSVLHGWKAAGLSPETCNKRRTALMALYHALDGKSAANPVRDVPKFRVAAPLPRALPYAAIEKALRTMPKCRTRARLKVMAYTGARPIQVRQIQPDDWDATRKTLLLRSTDKGAGTKPYRVPLSDKAQSALREFENTDAWGSFASAPMARMWKAALKAAQLPLDAVPYDLRHSFGTAVYRATGDLRITKELMGHASLAMTERYTLAAIPVRQQEAIAAAFGAKVPTK